MKRPTPLGYQIGREGITQWRLNDDKFQRKPLDRYGYPSDEWKDYAFKLEFVSPPRRARMFLVAWCIANRNAFAFDFKSAKKLYCSGFFALENFYDKLEEPERG